MGRRLSNLLSERLELPVQQLTSLAFLLLKLDLIFVAIAVLALSVPGLVELYIRGFSVKLDILHEQVSMATIRMCAATRVDARGPSSFRS